MSTPAQYHLMTDYLHEKPLGGILVCQKVYSNSQNKDYIQQPSIQFRQNGTLGVWLSSCTSSGDIPGLEDGEAKIIMSATGSTRMTLRVDWPGYRPFDCAINAQMYAVNAHGLSRKQLAKYVAKGMSRFVNEFVSEQINQTGAEHNWHITQDTFSMLKLVELRHVSQGSYQPVLVLVTNART